MAVPGIINPHEMPEEMQDWIVCSQDPTKLFCTSEQKDTLL